MSLGEAESEGEQIMDTIEQIMATANQATERPELQVVSSSPLLKECQDMAGWPVTVELELRNRKLCAGHDEVLVRAVGWGREEGFEEEE